MTVECAQDYSKALQSSCQLLALCAKHASLQGSSKDRFNEIQQELSQLSTKFSNNLLDATKAFKKMLKEPSEVWLICLSLSSLFGSKPTMNGADFRCVLR